LTPEPTTFDACGTWDPNDDLVSYSWDLDGDGEFDDCYSEHPECDCDWSCPYLGEWAICVEVCDVGAGGHDVCCDTDCTTLDCDNHPPVADAKGPYEAPPETEITLDGCASYDPDPGDAITYAWDLDEDGDYDDCSECACPFTTGPDVGDVTTVCLRVTDSFGESDTDCTTVEVIENPPPVAMCQDVTVAADETCQAEVTPEQVDDGSYDPNGDPIDLSLAPAGPYALGDTGVTLTVTDTGGLADSCEATVTVYDGTAPEIVCNNPPTIVPPDAPISFTATSSDNCGPTTTEITEYDCFWVNPAGWRIDKKNSCVVSFAGDTLTIHDSGGVDDTITWVVVATDPNGNTTTSECSLVVVNPGKKKN
jgi:hypothetical protein